MKAAFRLLGLFSMMILLPRAYGADVAGAWKGAFEFQGSTISLTLNLKTAGDGVTGTMEGLPTSPAEIHDGKIDGDAISFWLQTDYQGQTYKLLYKGKVTGDQMEFSFGTDDGSWGTAVTLKRGTIPAPPAADVTGLWKGSFELDGANVRVKMNLRSTGTVVNGTVEGLGRAPIEIHDGKIEGDTVSFWLNANYQGSTYAVSYKGRISPDKIEFSFGVADGAWSSAMTVKKL